MRKVCNLQSDLHNQHDILRRFAPIRSGACAHLELCQKWEMVMHVGVQDHTHNVVSKLPPLFSIEIAGEIQVGEQHELESCIDNNVFEMSKFLPDPFETKEIFA